MNVPCISPCVMYQQDVSVQIQGLRQQIRAQEKKQDLRVKKVKHMIKGDLKKQVAEEMRYVEYDRRADHASV